jgi:hypothetical protein
LELEINRLNGKIAEIKSNNDNSSVTLSKQQLQDLKDSTLFRLKLGTQAPGYKAAVKALDRFISDLLKLI